MFEHLVSSCNASWPWDLAGQYWIYGGQDSSCPGGLIFSQGSPCPPPVHPTTTDFIHSNYELEQTLPQLVCFCRVFCHSPDATLLPMLAAERSSRCFWIICRESRGYWEMRGECELWSTKWKPKERNKKSRDGEEDTIDTKCHKNMD